jgi:integrase
MAFVVRYKSTRFWVAGFRDASGKQHRRTTREVDRKRALVIAQTYERVAKRQGSPERVKQVIAELYLEHYGEALPTETLRHYGERWLAARRNETSPATHRRYKDALGRFLEFLGSKADRGMDQITRAEITTYRDEQCARVSASTANSYVKLVRMVFRSARRDGVIAQDVAEGVRNVRDTNRERARRPFTLGELKRVIEVAGPEWQSIIRCAVFTGQRLGDVVSLLWPQVDFEANEIRLAARKTGKRLVIPLAEPLREHLLTAAGSDNPRGALHPRAYAIMRAKGGRTGALSSEFGELLIDAGLREPRDHRSRNTGRDARRTGAELSFHSLRHLTTSLLKTAGVPDATVMALIGHESLLMSGHYTHVGKAELGRAVRALPEI